MARMATVPQTGQCFDSASLIPLVYQGLTDDHPWQELLQALRMVSHSEVAAITLRQGDTQRAPLIIWDRQSALSPEQVAQARADHARLIEADPLSAVLCQSGDIYTLDEVMPQARLAASPFYQSLMKPYGIGSLIGMCFEDPQGWRCSIGLMRLAGDVPFGQSEKALLLELLPHLEKALSLYRQLHHSQMERDIFAQSLGRLGLGVVILNRHRQVVECNKAAERILVEDRRLGLVDGRMAIARGAVDQAIQGALAASERGDAKPFVRTLRLNSARLGSLGLVIRSVQAKGGWYQGDTAPRVVIYLSHPGQDNIAPEQAVEVLFGLTHTEAVVALLLCNGFSLAQISQKLDVVENTARAYSKRIYAKMGISRQAELVRVVLRSVAFLA